MTGPTVGTCSICRGPVKMPMLMVDPIPTCERCGATAANPFGAVVKMVPTAEKTAEIIRTITQGA